VDLKGSYIVGSTESARLRDAGKEKAVCCLARYKIRQAEHIIPPPRLAILPLYKLSLFFIPSLQTSIRTHLKLTKPTSALAAM
jgi:hypothetical protein